jgi:2-polyprenyl-6-methoxyphenol hydroxylase-like FAD-dependent oxidoreductase
MADTDVLVVGAGPNGLSAAIAAARAGGDVGGGVHDIRQMLFRPSARLHSMPLAGGAFG